jgi:gluconokinase
MNLLCFDVSSGGISAALFNSRLEASRVAKNSWSLDTDAEGSATLSAESIVGCFRLALQSLELKASDASGSLDAICIGTFMHSCMLLDEADQPLTPLFTWLDSRGDDGLDYVRRRLGDRFHELTGCRYHPMFPIFKLAEMQVHDSGPMKRAKRVVSIKALLIHQLTGTWVEDYGMASASGLFNVAGGDWSSDILDMLDLERTQLPMVAGRTETVGRVTSSAAAGFGLSEGVPVIAGSGDGFLANLGSDCEVPSRIAVTLGTSGVARQTLTRPALDADAGTFCYRADKDAYLLGCAGSNGGNVLDWGDRILAKSKDPEVSPNPPIFIPLLHGERSPDWNPHLTGSWHHLMAHHTATDLSRSILEGVVFNLAHFIEIIQRTSGERATDVVLSGNGFLRPLAAQILAAVTGISIWMSKPPGLASLRGAGVCALRALSQTWSMTETEQVSPLADPGIAQRYSEYRRLRETVSESK